MTQVYDEQQVEILVCRLTDKEKELQKLVSDLETLAKVLGELKTIHEETVKARNFASEKWGEAETLLMEAKRQLAERDSIISDMDRRTEQLEEREKRAAELLRDIPMAGTLPFSRAERERWDQKRDQWFEKYRDGLRDAGVEK